MRTSDTTRDSDASAGSFSPQRAFGRTLTAGPPLALPAPRTPGAQPEVSLAVTTRPAACGLEGAVERFATAPAAGMDQPGFRFFELPDRAVIHITGSGEVHVTEDTITLHLTDPTHAFLGDIVLPGMALALWLERMGIATLHGAATDVDGAGVAFLAARGTGKSSIATHLTLNGDPLLTEDLLVVSWQGAVPTIEPGLAQLRLWPEQAARVVPDWRALHQPHPGFPKRRLLVGDGDGAVGRMATGPVPLRRLYLLERSDDPGYRPDVHPVGGATAVRELLTHSYLPEIGEGFGWHERRLRAVARLTAATHVRRLRIPDDLDRLDEVRDVIAADLRGDQEPS